MDLKCYPENTGSLRKLEGILPGYHMNKEHWISVVLEISVQAKYLHELIQDSYKLAK